MNKRLDLEAGYCNLQLLKRRQNEQLQQQQLQQLQQQQQLQ